MTTGIQVDDRNEAEGTILLSSSSPMVAMPTKHRGRQQRQSVRARAGADMPLGMGRYTVRMAGDACARSGGLFKGQ